MIRLLSVYWKHKVSSEMQQGPQETHQRAAFATGSQPRFARTANGIWGKSANQKANLLQDSKKLETIYTVNPWVLPQLEGKEGKHTLVDQWLARHRLDVPQTILNVLLNTAVFS